MFADKALRCDCGYEVRAYDEDALADDIRRHALEAHGIDFSVELALGLARSAGQVGEQKARGPGLEQDGAITREER